MNRSKNWTLATVLAILISGGAGAQNSGSGGSNCAFVDSSVRFVKFREVLGPINLWAVTDQSRHDLAVNR